MHGRTLYSIRLSSGSDSVKDSMPLPGSLSVLLFKSSYEYQLFIVFALGVYTYTPFHWNHECVQQIRITPTATVFSRQDTTAEYGHLKQTNNGYHKQSSWVDCWYYLYCLLYSLHDIRILSQEKSFYRIVRWKITLSFLFNKKKKNWDVIFYRFLFLDKI